jgi:phage antirepressor YoqD-like protein
MTVARQKTKKEAESFQKIIEQSGFVKELARPPKPKEKRTSENAPKIKTTGTFTIREAAEKLGFPPYKFFRMLREKGIVRSDNLPSGNVSEGNLMIATRCYVFSNGYSCLRPYTRITKKGIAYLKKLFLEEA